MLFYLFHKVWHLWLFPKVEKATRGRQFESTQDREAATAVHLKTRTKVTHPTIAVKKAETEGKCKGLRGTAQVTQGRGSRSAARPAAGGRPRRSRAALRPDPWDCSLRLCNIHQVIVLQAGFEDHISPSGFQIRSFFRSSILSAAASALSNGKKDLEESKLK